MAFAKLNSISQKAKQDSKLKFTSLAHHINVGNLAQCYKELKRDRACGIDGVTVEEYGRNLKENLERLVCQMKEKSYRPQPVRRVYIPKPGKSEKRGLGIPSVEDKLVQLSVKKILESIYENDFLDSSYGFRPGRNCHMAIDKLDKEVMTKPVNFIVEVDIRKFFDNVSHFWLLRCLEERVSDPNLLWLIRKLLKAGVMEAGSFHPSEVGTPQGGVASPLLANIYLHFVLDLWFVKKFKPTCKGHAEQIRYCDDFVVCFETKKDAERYLEELKERLGKFNLEVSPEKTKILEFGKRAWQRARHNKPASFTFLGFTHYATKSRRGFFIMGHKTSKENLRRSLRTIKDWVKKVRSIVAMKDWWPTLKAKLAGHYNYFGISGNFRCLMQFYRQVVSLVFKWINRRSQKKSMNWEKFQKYLQWHPLPTPRIYHSLYTLSPRRGSISGEPCAGKLHAGVCGGYHGDETLTLLKE